MTYMPPMHSQREQDPSIQCSQSQAACRRRMRDWPASTSQYKTKAPTIHSTVHISLARPGSSRATQREGNTACGYGHSCVTASPEVEHCTDLYCRLWKSGQIGPKGSQVLM
eukprot:366018-Chlamydomonas_euryale.AAC.5